MLYALIDLSFGLWPTNDKSPTSGIDDAWRFIISIVIDLLSAKLSVRFSILFFDALWKSDMTREKVNKGEDQ
jgi:hypothetical protein